MATIEPAHETAFMPTHGAAHGQALGSALDPTDTPTHRATL